MSHSDYWLTVTLYFNCILTLLKCWQMIFMIWFCKSSLHMILIWNHLENINFDFDFKYFIETILSNTAGTPLHSAAVRTIKIYSRVKLQSHAATTLDNFVTWPWIFYACQYRKKLAIDEWPWHTPKVIIVAAIKWPYGISLLVCELLFQLLYLEPLSKHYHFWRERDCLWPWELLHFWQRSLNYTPRAF